MTFKITRCSEMSVHSRIFKSFNSVRKLNLDIPLDLCVSNFRFSSSSPIFTKCGNDVARILSTHIPKFLLLYLNDVNMATIRTLDVVITRRLFSVRVFRFKENGDICLYNDDEVTCNP